MTAGDVLDRTVALLLEVESGIQCKFLPWDQDCDNRVEQAIAMQPTDLAGCLPKSFCPASLARIVPEARHTIAGASGRLKISKARAKTYLRWNSLRHFERQNRNVCSNVASISKVRVGAHMQERALATMTKQQAVTRACNSKWEHRHCHERTLQSLRTNIDPWPGYTGLLQKLHCSMRMWALSAGPA